MFNWLKRLLGITEPRPMASVIVRDQRTEVPFAMVQPMPVQSDLESVIKNDDRTLIPGYAPPWCAFCYLLGDFPNGQFVGTGWLINATTVITAGHNLWNPPLSAGEHKRAVGEARSITVVPAQPDLIRTPSGAIVTGHFVFDKRWQTEQDPKRRYYDYGAVLLPAPGIQLPFYFTPWAATPDEWLTYATLNCAGFPSERNGRFLKATGKLCADQTTGLKFLGPNKEMAIHDIDTTGGESGAPVFWTDGNSEYYVLGIHTQGIGLADGFNACIRITPEMLATFDRWGAGATATANIQGPQTVA